MDSAEKLQLWKAYADTRSSEIKEKIIIEYAPLVKIVAGRLGMYLGYNVEFDDLVGYGVFGLIDAIDKFDYQKGIKFETYASLRIRGEILDQIRKMDWIPRSVRQKQKKLDSAISKLELELGRVATDAEIASELDITEEELLNWQGQANITNIVSLDEFIEVGGEKSIEPDMKNTRFEQPEKAIEKEELSKMLMSALDMLTEKEKKVVLLYYYEELTLKEISRVLEVTESRISQLHTKALQKLKVKLGDNSYYLFSV